MEQPRVDIRTRRDIEREQRHEKVCGRFKELRDQFPEASVSRICDIIGEEMVLSLQGVRKILIQHGLYTTTKTA